MRIGRIRNGVYERCSGESAPTHDIMSDYYKGIAPSDLSRLDSRQLYMAAERIHENVANGVGSKDELAKASEALNEVYHERYRRRATIR